MRQREKADQREGGREGGGGKEETDFDFNFNVMKIDLVLQSVPANLLAKHILKTK